MTENRPASSHGSIAAADAAEVWIERFGVRVGNVLIEIHRTCPNLQSPPCDADRWTVIPPDWDDHIGNPRSFDTHVEAQQFAGRLAAKLDAASAVWHEAMREIRSEWQPEPSRASDSRPASNDADSTAVNGD